MQKKGGGGGQLQTKNLIRVVSCKMCMFLLFCMRHDIHYIKCFMEELVSLLFIIFILFIIVQTQWQTALGVVVWQWVPTFKDTDS